MFLAKKGHFAIIFDNFFQEFFFSIVYISICVINQVPLEKFMEDIYLLILAFLGPLMKVVTYLTTKLEINETHVIITSGLLIKQKKELPREKISSVNLTQNFISQIFDVQKVSIDNNALSVEKEVSMAFKTEIALQIKSILMQDIKDTKEESLHIEKYNTKDLALLGLLQPKTKYILGTISSIFLIMQFVPERYLKALVNFVDVIKESSVISIILMILLTLFITTIISIFFTIIKYYGFTVTTYEDKINLRYGLLRKVDTMIPKKRVCALKVTRSLLMQATGFYQLFIISSGVGVDEGATQQTILLPVVKKKHLNQVIENNFNDYSYQDQVIKSPKKALKYHFFNFWLFLCIGIMILGLYSKEKNIVIIALILLLYTIFNLSLYYQRSGVALLDDCFIIKNSYYTTTTTIVCYPYIEGIISQTNRFKIKKQISTIKIYFFGPPGFNHLKIKLVDMKLFETLKEKV